MDVSKTYTLTHPHAHYLTLGMNTEAGPFVERDGVCGGGPPRCHYLGRY